LFDHFQYLASPESKWDHTLVGWTGEITAASQTKNPFGDREVTEEFLALMKASGPVPVDGKPIKAQLQSVEGLNLSPKDRANLEKKMEQEHNGKMVPVWLADSFEKDTDNILLKDQRRWSRFSEKELYPLFHYKQNEPSDGRAMKKAWADYQKMNQIFADRIMEIYKPGDVIVVHDHQLMLLPCLLRQRMPSIYIGFFLHIPFPSSEMYRCLKQRNDLLEGVLGANMAGFQSFSYSRHFSSCCKRILNFDSSRVGVDAYGAHVAVEVFPIGVNASAILGTAFDDPEIAAKIPALREQYAGKKIIVGRDRLDAIRGVPQKLQAFETFLNLYPQWRDKVVLIQITSSTENPDKETLDQKYINSIANMVAKINGKWGSLSSAPVQYFPQYVPRQEYYALLRIADLGLITSVRDGMNTTSLEYVLCQRDNHSPLILSEFSGTAGSLADAIHVNPWDYNSVADTINKALTMSVSERNTQHEKLYRYVTKNDTRAWSDKFLSRLLTNLSSYDQSFATPVLDRSQLLKQYRAAKKRLIMLDYDGTLTPIVKDPQAAIPSDKVLRTLKQLSSNPANSVWIISGRDQKFLDEWMGHISDLGLSAEHGSFMRHPKAEEWENIAAGMDMGWRDEVSKVFNHYTERTQGELAKTH
jgi:trehalose 6-phosphate synthase/phosphatase